MKNILKVLNIIILCVVLVSVKNEVCISASEIQDISILSDNSIEATTLSDAKENIDIVCNSYKHNGETISILPFDHIVSYSDNYCITRWTYYWNLAVIPKGCTVYNALDRGYDFQCKNAEGQIVPVTNYRYNMSAENPEWFLYDTRNNVPGNADENYYWHCVVYNNDGTVFINGIEESDSGKTEDIALGFSRGDGTIENPFIISNKEELLYFQQSVKNGTNYSGQYIALLADINFNSVSDFDSWSDQQAPKSKWEGITGFAGTFDGRGHTISGIYIKRSEDNTGFFNAFNNLSKVVVRNLNLKDVYISGTNNVGGIVGFADYVQIENCSVSGKVIGSGDHVGGIIGYSGSPGHRGTLVQGSTNYATVKGNSDVGGVVGHTFIGNAVGAYNPDNYGGREMIVLNSCKNKGNIIGTGYHVGGIAGYLNRSMNCGGLDIDNVGNSGNVTGSNDVGGVIGCIVSWVGSLGATTLDCGSNIGNISGNTNVGGIIGYSNWIGGTATQCNNVYNAGTISGNDSTIGGIIGYSSKGNKFVCVFNAGKVKNANGGTLVGYSRGAEFYNSYYMIDEENPVSSNGATLLSKEEFRREKSFSGFDFINIWYMDKLYPVLRCQNNMSGGNNEQYKEIDINELPHLSEDDAILFLKFIYNKSNLENTELKDTRFLDLLTGKFDSFSSEEELRRYIWSFSTFARANINAQVKQSTYISQYCTDELYGYLMNHLSSENVASDIITGALEVFSKEINQEINSMLKVGYSSIAADEMCKSIISALKLANVQSYIDETIAVIQSIFLALNQDNNARAAYFNAYLILRQKYNATDDPMFLSELNIALYSINVDNEFSQTLWIIGKEPWTNHTEVINRWAEYLFKLKLCAFEKEISEGPTSGITDSGQCGSSLRWIMYEDGTLSIVGTGAMDNYSELAPWALYGQSINVIDIQDGVTSIGNNAFLNQMTNIREIKIPKTVNVVGQSAFAGIKCQCDIKYEGLLSDWHSISILQGNDPLIKLYDSDGDYIPDDWERNGVDYDGDGIIDLPLNKMGADPSIKDIFVEVDWMEKPAVTIGPFTIAEEISFGPTETQLKLVFDAFKRNNINLHLDAGPDSYDFVTGEKWGTNGKGKKIDYEEVFTYPSTFFKDGYLNPEIQEEFGRYPSNLCKGLTISTEDTIFKYCIFGNYFKSRGENTREKSTGLAYVGSMKAPYIFIANTEGLRKGDTKGANISVAGTFMHELGHSLGLQHGGSDKVNYKPNYLSVMNYSFQNIGVIGDYPIDYSGVKLPTLNTQALCEKYGIDNYDSGIRYLSNNEGTIIFLTKNNRKVIENVSGKPIDFNFNGIIDEGIVSIPTVDSDNPSVLLEGYNDWENIPYYRVNNHYYNKGNVLVTSSEELPAEQNLQEALARNVYSFDNSGYFTFAGPFTLLSNVCGQSIFFDITNCNNHMNDYKLIIESSDDNFILSNSYEYEVEGSITDLTSRRVEIPVRDNLQDGVHKIVARLYCGGEELGNREIKVQVYSPNENEIKQLLSDNNKGLFKQEIWSQYNKLLSKTDEQTSKTVSFVLTGDLSGKSNGNSPILNNVNGNEAKDITPIFVSKIENQKELPKKKTNYIENTDIQQDIIPIIAEDRIIVDNKLDDKVKPEVGDEEIIENDVKLQEKTTSSNNKTVFILVGLAVVALSSGIVIGVRKRKS